MTSKESQIIGQKYSLLSALYIFFIYELLAFLSSIKGDFANGILFFIEEQMTLSALIIYGIYFLSFFTLGRIAGYRILLKGNNYIIVGLLFSLLTAAGTFIKPIIELKKMYNLTGVYIINEKEAVIRSAYIVITIGTLLILCGWMIAVVRINKRKPVV